MSWPQRPFTKAPERANAEEPAQGAGVDEQEQGDSAREGSARAKVLLAKVRVVVVVVQAPFSRSCST